MKHLLGFSIPLLLLCHFVLGLCDVGLVTLGTLSDRNSHLRDIYICSRRRSSPKYSGVGHLIRLPAHLENIENLSTPHLLKLPRTCLAPLGKMSESSSEWRHQRLYRIQSSCLCLICNKSIWLCLKSRVSIIWASTGYGYWLNEYSLSCRYMQLLGSKMLASKQVCWLDTWFNNFCDMNWEKGLADGEKG